MPLYEIEHYVPLRDNQKDALAKQITNIHSRLFTTPSLFVNIRFLDKGGSGDCVYVGGKKRNLNRILAHVRPGGPYGLDAFNQLCDLVTEAWNRCVNDGNTAKRPTELHGIFVLGDILAGTEAGFSLPAAGEDKAWLAANYGKFRERAKYGDQDFKDVLLEMKERDDLREEEIPPTYDSATTGGSPTTPASPNTAGIGRMGMGSGFRSPRIGQLGFERDGKR